jgi:hypothetical protein
MSEIVLEYSRLKRSTDKVDLCASIDWKEKVYHKRFPSDE